MYGKPRRRVRGRPFKLFSDELPNTEHDDSSETVPFNDTTEEEPRRGRGKKKRMQSFNDRLSLPSLGTPDGFRDDTSVAAMSDSRISSGQSFDQSTAFSPNLEELQNRIRQRHGVRDSGPSTFLHGGLPRRSTTLKYGPTDRPVVIKREKIIRDTRLADLHRKGGTIETHFEKYENAFTDEFGKIESRKPMDDEAVKRKSILQQLLDASARDFNKRKQINDGLIPNPGDPFQRTPGSGPLSRNDLRQKETTPVTDGATDSHPSRPDDSKRGILKRESHKDRHSVRVPKVPMPHGVSPKPRLVHNDEIENFEDYASRYVESPGGIISVHYDVPRNKVNDMLLLPNKTSKKKRVYFKDKDEFRDIPSNAKNESRFRELGRKPTRRRKPSPYPSDDVDIKFESHVYAFENEEVVTDRPGEDTKGLARSRSLRPLPYRHTNRRRGSPHAEPIPDPDTKAAGEDVNGYTDRHDNMTSFQREFFVGEPYFGDGNSVFSTPSPRKELQALDSDKDHNNNNNKLRGSRPIIPGIPTSVADPIKLESVTPSRSETPKLNTRLRRVESERVGKPLNIPKLVLSDDIHMNGHYIGSRNPEAIGLNDLPDDFDLSELPEDIDRSLDGVELIKAYRLWDRERKNFPAGLRKIEIPFDPKDFILSKIKNANAKTQRPPNSKQEVKVTLV